MILKLRYNSYLFNAATFAKFMISTVMIFLLSDLEYLAILFHCHVQPSVFSPVFRLLSELNCASIVDIERNVELG